MGRYLDDPNPNAGVTCAYCHRHYTHDELLGSSGWLFRPDGESCPHCSLKELKRIDRMARDVIATGLPFTACVPRHAAHSCDVCTIAQRADTLRYSAEGLGAPLGL